MRLLHEAGHLSTFAARSALPSPSMVTISRNSTMGGPAIYELSKHFGQFEEVQRSPNHVSDSIRLYPIIHQYLSSFAEVQEWNALEGTIHVNPHPSLDCLFHSATFFNLRGQHSRLGRIYVGLYDDCETDGRQIRSAILWLSNTFK